MSTLFAGHEMRPRKLAVVGETPQNFDTTTEAPIREPLFIEGFNVRELTDAITWLTKVHERDAEGFEVPRPKGDIDRQSGRDITYNWSRVRRDSIHEDGSHQNDAEHSAVAAMTAIELLGRLGTPRELVAEVCMKLIVHDRDEAPSNDIGVFDRRRPEKPYREEASYTILDDRDQDNPLMAQLMHEKKHKLTEADLIVDSLEKTEPALHALSTRCATERLRGDHFPAVVRKTLMGAASHESGFRLATEVLVLVGDNWNKWGCKPYYGDAKEIVNSIADEVMVFKKMAKAKVYEFPNKTLQNAEVVLDPTRGPKVVPKMGNLALARAKRAEDKAHNSLDFEPTPPLAA